MRVNLTERFIAGRKPPKTGRDEYADTEARGLVLRVTADGARSWAVRYTVRGDAKGQRRTTIGAFPGMPLSRARGEAFGILAAAKAGRDLPAEERAKQQQAEAEADRPQTNRELFERYLKLYVAKTHRKAGQTRRLFELHVFDKPKFANLRPGETRRGDVVALLDDLETEKRLTTQRNRVRSQIIAGFDYAVEREWIPANPAAGVKKKAEPDPQEQGRELTVDELRAIWRAAVEIGYPGGHIVRLLMLTGGRRDEARCAPRTELAKDLSEWIIPGTRYKTKRPHLVPLSEPARDLLASCPKSGPYLFSLNGKKPYAGHSRLKRIIDRRSGVKGWTLHDLRRAVRTQLSALQVPADIRARVLGHAKVGMDRVYDLHDFKAEKKAALQRWAAYLMDVVARRDRKVVPLRAG